MVMRIAAATVIGWSLCTRRTADMAVGPWLANCWLCGGIWLLQGLL